MSSFTKHGGSASGPIGPYRRGFGNPSPLFDRDERPEPRRHHPVTSRKANERAQFRAGTDKAKIMALAAAAAGRGITVIEVAAALGKHRSSVSGRLSELREAGALTYKLGPDYMPVERDGCLVHVLPEYALSAIGEGDDHG
jgi:DNA-binding transcriptional ArsR family regulator